MSNAPKSNTLADTKAADAKAADVATFLDTFAQAETEAVTAAAKATLSSAVTLTKRTSGLGEALAAMLAATEAESVTFADYARAAAAAIAEAGDWTRADTEIRKAVAAIAGTVGRLSSVVVADAIGLSQSTASRAIREAKRAEVTWRAERAAEAAAEEVRTKAADQGHDTGAAEVTQAAEEAARRARAEETERAEAEAAAIVTAAGYVMASGRGTGRTVGRKGKAVARSAAEVVANVAALADGTVSAEELRALAESLAKAAEQAAALVDTLTKAEEEAAEAAAAEEQAAAKVKAEEEAAKAARRAEAEAARVTKAEAKRVRPIVAAVIGDEAVADMSDAEVVGRARDILTAAKAAATA